jgi:hypothetical protein
MCDCKCKCAEAKAKPQRVFDILVTTSGDYVYDVSESKLSETIEELCREGYEVQDLRITQEVFVQPVWTIVD